MMGPSEMFWATFTLISGWVVLLVGFLAKTFICDTPYLVPLMLLAWLLSAVVAAFLMGDL